ncbi:MAG: DUF2752 domain-containing protein [Acidobacteriia bacterium]|nr:DUF2752 domain-containing protein [Terriglobia bacterium]
MAPGLSARVSEAVHDGSLVQAAFSGGLLVTLHFLAVPLEPRWTLCAYEHLTGRPCPLCGLTRALSLLLHGQWASALHFNVLSPLVLVMLGGMLITALAQLSGYRRRRPWFSSVWKGRAWTAVSILFLVYGVVRFFKLMV